MSLQTLTSKANVSDLMLYMKCPRHVYYANREHEFYPSITSSYIEHLILKELAMSYTDVIRRSDRSPFLTELSDEIDRIQSELELIHSADLKDVTEDILTEAKENVKALLPQIAQNLFSTAQDIGKDDLIRLLEPYRNEPVLYSQRLMMTGIPSALISYKGKIVPLNIRTGKCPGNGVWLNEKIQMAAHILLVEETYDENIDTGLILYARHGLLRRVKVRAEQRRQVLKIRTRVDRIKGGQLPEKKTGPLCKHCKFTHLCDTGSSLASKFL